MCGKGGGCGSYLMHCADHAYACFSPPPLSPTQLWLSMVACFCRCAWGTVCRVGRSMKYSDLSWWLPVCVPPPSPMPSSGLPLSPEFAVTHITALASRSGGPAALCCGPTPWGTVLQLPDSWVGPVTAAVLPEEDPLGAHLEVRVCVFGGGGRRGGCVTQEEWREGQRTRSGTQSALPLDVDEGQAWT
jgi:hypothetical protein